MKYLLIIFFLLPFVSQAQTVHLDEGRIRYHDSIKTKKPDVNALQQNLHDFLTAYDHGTTLEIVSESPGKTIASGKMKLSSPQGKKNSLSYQLTLAYGDAGWHYDIDSVKFIDRTIGGKTEIMSSKEMVDNMEVTGPVASATEKILNEVDMHFQELITRMKKEVKKD